MLNEKINSICLITETSEKTFHKTKVAIMSFLSKNEWFRGKIIVLTTSELKPTDIQLNSLFILYNNIVLEEIESYSKSNIEDVILDSLRIESLRIKSQGNIYISRNSIILNNIRSCIDLDSIITFDLNNKDIRILDTLDKIDTNFMYIPEDYINDYSILSEDDSIDNNINYIINENGLNIKQKFIISHSSNFPDSKYASFIRYSKAISIIIMDSSGINFRRINTFWISMNKSLTIKYSKPSKIIINKEDKQETSLIMNKGSYSMAEISNKNLSLDGLKYGICTVCNDGFIKGGMVLLHSFLKNNKWFKGDFIFLYSDKYSPLSTENRLKLKKIYEYVKFEKIDDDVYSQVFERFKIIFRGTNRERFLPSLFTYEVFNLSNIYDKILFLDADMIVIKNISELFGMTESIVVTPDASQYNVEKRYTTFNGGFILVNSPQPNTREKLLKYSLYSNRYSLFEQEMMNVYFNGNIYFINSNYNCLKRCFNDSNFNKMPKDVKIIHYVGAKPWTPVSNKRGIERRYTKIESIWINHYSQITNDDYIIRENANVSEPVHSKVSIITSSCKITPIVKNILKDSEILTANWGISLDLPRINYYLCSTVDSNLIKMINKRTIEPEHWLLTDNVKKEISGDFTNTHLFSYLNGLGSLGKSHMRPLKERGKLNLPTTGVQMIYLASFMNIKQLFIFGINLYTVKDDKGNYKLIGSTSKENPYKMSNKPHSMETDITFIYDSFKRMIDLNVQIITDSEILDSIYDMIKEEYTLEEIIKKYNK